MQDRLHVKNFYPRSPCGERPKWQVLDVQPKEISIHALLAESDSRRSPLMCSIRHFYPRSPCGERPPMTLRHCTTYLFLSTLSLRRATLIFTRQVCVTCHFYPRSPCGERPYIIRYAVNLHTISIHALLAESDNGYLQTHQLCAISIHALLAESDNNINNSVSTADKISIHALLAESDSKSAQNSGALLRI